MIIRINNREEVCANCEHFTQHYVMFEGFIGGIGAINAGHCAYPRIKDRKPGHPACENFEVRRKYELLQRKSEDNTKDGKWDGYCMVAGGGSHDI